MQRPCAFLLALCAIAGLTAVSCRKVENPMPSDLKRSGFLFNYTIANPEPETAKITPPAPKRFPHGKLRILAGHDFFSKGIIDSYTRKSDVEIEKGYYANYVELNRRVSAGEPFDIAISSGFMMKIMASEGRLAELNYSNIPDIKYVSPEFRSLPFDPTNKYGVASTIGIAFNSKALDVTPHAWKDLFEPPQSEQARLAGKVALLASPHRVFAASLTRLGHSPNSIDPGENAAAVDYLKSVTTKTKFAFIPQDAIYRALENESVLLAMAHSSDVTRIMTHNPGISFTVPVDGSWISFDCAVILRRVSPQQKEIAEDFINFLLHPSVAAEISNFTMKASTEAAARPFLSPSLKHGPSYLRPNGGWTALLAEADSDVQERVFKDITAEKPEQPTTK